MPVGGGTAGSLRGAHEDPTPHPPKQAHWWPQMVVHVESSHGRGTRTRVGEVLITGHPSHRHLQSSGPAHLALSAKRCGWVLGSGRGHGMGWCSCACGGRPGTSLGRERVPGLSPQPHATFFNTHIHTPKGLLGNANEHFPPLAGSLLEPKAAANLPGPPSPALLPGANLHLFL